MEPRRSLRSQAESTQEAVTQEAVPLALLLQYPDVYEAMVFYGFSGYEPFAPGWGTIFNRKIEVRISTLPNAGRGLFAGPAVEGGFNGFKAKDVITLYGGQLLTEKPAEERAAEHTHMLSIPPRGGSAPAWVDGRKFADGISQEPDAEGLFLPLPGMDYKAHWHQGAGSVMNDPTKIQNYRQLGIDVNAKWKYRKLGTGAAAELKPKVPMVVATKDIAPGEEIFIRYGSEKPFHGVAVAAGERAAKRPRGEFRSLAAGDAGPSAAAAYRGLAAADDDEEVPAYKSMAAAAACDDAADEEDAIEDEELLAKLAELGW